MELCGLYLTYERPPTTQLCNFVRELIGKECNVERDYKDVLFLVRHKHLDAFLLPSRGEGALIVFIDVLNKDFITFECDKVDVTVNGATIGFSERFYTLNSNKVRVEVCKKHIIETTVERPFIEAYTFNERYVVECKDKEVVVFGGNPVDLESGLPLYACEGGVCRVVRLYNDVSLEHLCVRKGKLCYKEVDEGTFLKALKEHYDALVCTHCACFIVDKGDFLALKGPSFLDHSLVPYKTYPYPLYEYPTFALKGILLVTFSKIEEMVMFMENLVAWEQVYVVNDFVTTGTVTLKGKKVKVEGDALVF